MIDIYNPFLHGYIIAPKHIPDKIQKNRCARELFNYFLHNVNFRLKDGIMRGQMSTSYKKIKKDLAWSYGRGVQTYTDNDIDHAIRLLKKYTIISTKVSRNDFMVNFLTYDLTQDKDNYKLLKSQVDFECAFYAATCKNGEESIQSSDTSRSEKLHRDGGSYGATYHATCKNGEESIQSSDTSRSEKLHRDFQRDALVHTPVKRDNIYIYNNNNSNVPRENVPRQEWDENVPQMSDEERDEILQEHEYWKESFYDHFGSDNDTPF